MVFFPASLCVFFLDQPKWVQFRCFKKIRIFYINLNRFGWQNAIKKCDGLVKINPPSDGPAFQARLLKNKPFTQTKRWKDSRERFYKNEFCVKLLGTSSILQYSPNQSASEIYIPFLS